MRVVGVLLLSLVSWGQAGSPGYFFPSHRISGVGVERDDLSEDTLRARTQLMIESQTFGIMREQEAVAGAKRVTDPKLQAIFRAAAEGYPVIDNVPKYFPNFPYVTWAVRPAWAKDHPDLVVSFIKAQLQAARWLYDPANKQKALALLSEQTNTTVDDASKSYDVFVNDEKYFSTTGTFAPEGFNRVVQTMLRAGMLPASPPAGVKYYDNTYAERANGQLR